MGVARRELERLGDVEKLRSQSSRSALCCWLDLRVYVQPFLRGGDSDAAWAARLDSRAETRGLCDMFAIGPAIRLLVDHATD